MEISKRLARLPFFPLLIAVSFFVGWFIPAFYDWTGADQSRPSPLVGQTAFGMTAGAIIVWLALPWLPIANSTQDADQPVLVRFKIRTMLVMTAGFAVLIAALTRFPIVVSGGVCAITACYVVRFWIRNRHYRWQTAALLACMCLPFVWIVAYDELDNVLPAVLWLATGLPSLLPTMIISGLVGQHSRELIWLSILLTSAEIVIGIWMIRLGPRRTIAYLVFVLLMSTLGSFGLNALMRA